ncbi:MAG: hypothetical protein RIS29_923 [Bacteroidota bacterium]|jgi:hypothetical protein
MVNSCSFGKECLLLCDLRQTFTEKSMANVVLNLECATEFCGISKRDFYGGIRKKKAKLFTKSRFK